MPVPTPWMRRPPMSRSNRGAAAHRTVPATKSAMAVRNRDLVRKRRLSREEIGMIAARTRR